MRKPLLAAGLLVGVGIGVPALASVPAGTPSGLILGVSAPNADLSRNLASGVSGAAIVQYAMKLLGYPYTATGNSPSTGFSCIGFVSYVYRSLGINLPGDLSDAMAFAPPVSFSSLLPGDILYFQNTVWAGLSHAAIYIGAGKFIHAEWYNRGVVISSFTNDPVDGNYWTGHYLGANRPWTGVTGSPTASLPTVQPTPTPSKTATSPASGTTAQVPTGPTAVVRVSALNVRSGPSLSAAIRTVATRGTRVVILRQRRGWYKVALPGGEIGWVIGFGIGKGGAPRQRAERSGGSAKPSSSAGLRARRSTAPRTRTTTKRLQTHGTVTVQVNGLRVHAAPSLTARVLDSAYSGERLAVVRMASSWVKVQLPDGRVGWISRQFVQSQTSRRTARVSAAINRSVRGESKAKVALNVRAGPSLSSAIVAVLAPGGSYRILRWFYGWAHVRLAHGGIGWISGSALRSAAATTASVRTRRSSSGAKKSGSAAAGPFVTAGVRVHSGPSLNSPAIGLVATGTHVHLLGSVAGWAKVRLPTRQIGYILGIYVAA